MSSCGSIEKDPRPPRGTHAGLTKSLHRFCKPGVWTLLDAGFDTVPPERSGAAKLPASESALSFHF